MNLGSIRSRNEIERVVALHGEGGMAESIGGIRPPLCVDCDGTLLKTDLLFESIFALLKKSPLTLFFLPFWLLQGKVYLKQRLAERVNLDVTLLPYNDHLVNFLREAKSQGRKLVLVTASPRKFAQQIADHLELFDSLMATDKGRNLSGKNKRDSLVAAFGERGFEYAANGRIDLEVWGRARGAILVNARRSVQSKAAKITQVLEVFPTSRVRPAKYLKALRLHQWAKNLLVFVPLFAGHLVYDFDLLTQAAIAFVAYGLTASSGYILNDLLDLSADRGHPRKRLRPFASGDLPIAHGIVLIPCLLAAAVALSVFFLPPSFSWLLGGYYLTTLAYSLWIKNEVVLDVITLAGLYSFRVLAGAAATEIQLSFWLLAFTMCISLSLALVKRYFELRVMLKDGKETAGGRGYHIDDLPFLQNLGTATGGMAVLVLALYINSPDITRHYSQPKWLWFLCPLLLYWISHTWMKTHRGEMHDDPLVFALQDRLSQLMAVFGAIILILATLG
jgi:4-hydroxybenzoate polyprenyltransferase